MTCAPSASKHVRVVGQLIEPAAGVGCCVQVLPPSVVDTKLLAPDAPTPSAKQVVALGQLLPTSWMAGDVCIVQVPPPVVVATIVAGELPAAPVVSPTAMQVLELGQLMLLSV